VQIQLNVNGHPRQVDVEADAPLLWVIRDELNLTGTKFGCGVGACGACTVHVNGKPMRSCVLPVSAVVDAQVTTIEGIGTGTLSAVQAAWIQYQVPQCGYCQSGVIMAVSALLASTPTPTEDELGTLITNICRCGTYTRMRAAVSSLAGNGARK
jgi:isoquinoline 1-oxidoreductase alpha subunit